MAQIITLNSGYHNSDLALASARLTESGAWKKQRIVYIVPTGDKLMAEAYLSHRNLIFPPNQAMVPILIKNAEVGAAFQSAIDVVLANPGLRDFEYVLTIEHDNIPPTGTEVLRLLKAMDKHPEYASISGLYWTKGEGGVPQIWGDIKDPVQNYRPQRPIPGQVIECYGIGMGFALYRMSMFKELEAKKVPKPWFKTLGKDPDDKGVGTQDLYFWGQVARPNGFRCAVDCDTTIGHIADDGRIW
jgi:hypothetical protein